MSFFKRLGMLLRMNLLSVPQRLGLVCTTGIGVTCAPNLLAARDVTIRGSAVSRRTRAR